MLHVRTEGVNISNGMQMQKGDAVPSSVNTLTVLLLLVMFVAQISTSVSVPVPRMSVLYHNFLVISRRISLVSSD
jgi:hypothetical protein